jgi:hypothetical protein
MEDSMGASRSLFWCSRKFLSEQYTAMGGATAGGIYQWKVERERHDVIQAERPISFRLGCASALEEVANASGSTEYGCVAKLAAKERSLDENH